MLCNKCGGEIPEQSKFCPLCGTMQQEAKKEIYCTECGLMLEAGTSFCPVCGTPTGSKAPAPSVNMPTSGGMAAISAAPAAASAVAQSAVPSPVPQSVPTPMQSVPTPVQSVPTPVQSVPTPVQSVPTPVQSVPTPVQSVPTPVQSVPTPVQSAPTPVQLQKPSDAVFGAYNAAYGSEPKPSDLAFGSANQQQAKPSDLAFGAANQQQVKPSDIAFGAGQAAFGGNADNAVPIQPEASPLQQTALAPKKSKKWVGPVIGVAAAAAVVCGGAAIYHFNKSDITNMVMGDSGYAKMLEQNSIKKLVNSGNNAAVAEAAGSVMAAAASANMTELPEIDDPTDVQEEILDSQSHLGTGLEDIDFGAGIEELYSQMIESTGSSGASVKISAEADITETLRALISSGDSEADALVDEILGVINSTEVEFTALTAKDSVSMYAGVNDTAAGFSFGASGIIYNDGTVGLIFPRSSDVAIKYKVEADGSQTSEEITKPNFDEKEVQRLIDEITELYLSYYEKGEVTVSSEDGLKVVEVRLLPEQIEEFVKQAAALIAEDTYFSEKIVEYVNENGGELTVEEYKSDITDSVKDIDVDDNCVLVVTTTVDKQNNVVAKKFAVLHNDTKKSVEIGYTTKNKDTEMFIATNEDGTSQVLTVLIDAENETDGVITVSFDEYEGSERVENDEDFILDIKYNNCKLEAFGKSQIMTGNYEISVRKAISLDTADENVSNPEALTILQSTKLIYSSELLSENNVKQSITIEVPQYASLKLSVTQALINDAPEKIPENAVDLNKLAESEDTEELSNTIDKLMSDIIEKAQASGSKLGGFIAEGAEELRNGALSDLTPKADEEMINQLNARLDSLTDECRNLYSLYYEIMEDEHNQKYEEITDKIYDTYGYFEMSMDEYNAAVSELENIELEMMAFEEQLKEASEKAIEKQYNDMDVVELEYSREFLDYYYEEILDEYSDLISNDAELSEAFTEVMGKKTSCDAAFAAYDDMMKSSSNLDISLIRKCKKAAAAYDIAMTSFLNILYSVTE